MNKKLLVTTFGMILGLLTSPIVQANGRPLDRFDSSGLSSRERHGTSMTALPPGTPVRFVYPRGEAITFNFGRADAVIEAHRHSTQVFSSLTRSGDLNNVLRLAPEKIYRVIGSREVSAEPIVNRLLNTRTGRLYNAVASKSSWVLDLASEDRSHVVTLTCRQHHGPFYSPDRTCGSCWEALAYWDLPENYPDLPSEVQPCTLGDLENVLRVAAPLAAQ